MQLVTRATSIALLLGVAGLAHAVPYALPTSAALPFSQIQPQGGGRTVCATWLDDGACDVPPGTYRLLTYTPDWDGEPARSVTIGGSGGGDGSESAPANLRVDVYSTRSLELFWERPAAGVATRYEVRRDGEVVGVKDGTSFYETGLAPGRTYRYEVARVPLDGARSAVATVSATTGGGSAPPTPATEPAPANLRANVYSTRSLELFWERPAPGVETRYEIRRDGVPIAIKDGTSFYETGLAPGGYRYEVTRVPSSGERSATARLEISTTGDDGGMTGGGTTGGGGTGSTIDLDSYETVLREVIDLVNGAPFEAVREALPDVGDIGTREPGAGLTLASREDGAERESLPASRYPENFPEPLDGEPRVDATGERLDYVCDAGGELDVLVTSQGGGGGVSYRVHSDCALDGSTFDGVVLVLKSAGRPFGRIEGLDVAVAALDGTDERTLRGWFRADATSFVSDSFVNASGDVAYREEGPDGVTEVDAYSSTLEFLDLPPIGPPGTAALREDGSRVEFRRGGTTRTLDAGFAVGAPWSGGETLDVTVDLGFEDVYYEIDGLMLEVEELGPLFAPDGSGTPLELDFEREEPSYWQSGELRVEAPDGSVLRLLPRDAETFVIDVDGVEIERRWDEEGFEIR